MKRTPTIRRVQAGVRQERVPDLAIENDREQPDQRRTNTAIRKRKMRGEESLVYSMSREERGEAPGGMAGIIR